MLKFSPKSPIIPSIHTHPTASGKKEITVSSILENDKSKNAKTIKPQI